MPSRDKESTKKKILQAVSDLLAEGSEDLGINRIAERSGVDKVLIYRYFGGLPGLLSACAREGGVWPEFEEIMETAPSVAALLPSAEIGERFVAGFVRELLDRPRTLEILRQGLVKSNDLTREAAAVRERLLGELVECHADDEREAAAARYALVTAGLIHLMLHAAAGEPFCTVDLRSPHTWDRIRSTASRALSDN